VVCCKHINYNKGNLKEGKGRMTTSEGKGKTRKDSKVISIRVKEETHEKLNDIQELMKEKYHVTNSFADTFEYMVNIFYRYMVELDIKEYDVLVQKTMLKALFDESETEVESKE
jgi:hypothetical protein